jgi:hypothetical protein
MAGREGGWSRVSAFGADARTVVRKEEEMSERVAG